MGRILSGMATGFKETAKRDMRSSNSVFARSMAASMDKRSRQRADEPAFQEPTVPGADHSASVEPHPQHYSPHHAVQQTPVKHGIGLGKKVLIGVGITVVLFMVLPVLMGVLTMLF